jgi:predicted flap endonuclease-1-like 5' DNA nuclease
MINQNLIIQNNLRKIQENKRLEVEIEATKKEVDRELDSELKDIKWIWPWTIKTLYKHNIRTVSDLCAVSEDVIKEITNPLWFKALTNFINNNK